MHFFVRNIAVTVGVATVAIILLCLAAVFAVFNVTHTAVPTQTIALTLALPAVLVPAIVYPLLFLYRREKQLLRKLEQQAHTDALTDLPNRRAFFEFARMLLDRPRSDDRPLAAMTIDVDHFKSVNDRFGHDHGDMVLRRIAGIIRTEVSNARATDWIAARLGGEEFAILASGLAPSAVGRLAERICNQVHLSVGAGAYLEPVTVSLGVAFHQPGMKIDRLLKLSDDAVYDAKDAGRDRWAFAAKEGGRQTRNDARAAG